MVARAGIEPATFHFSGERCYQLSYLAKKVVATTQGYNATPTGLEPATSAVTGRRANQLRYGALTANPGNPGLVNYSQQATPAATWLFRAPNRIRTGATALKGRCPGPLDDGDPA